MINNSGKSALLIFFLIISAVAALFSLIAYNSSNFTGENKKEDIAIGSAEHSNRNFETLKKTDNHYNECSPFGSLTDNCFQSNPISQEEMSANSKTAKTEQQQLDEFYAGAKDMVSKELSSAFSGDPEAINNMKKIIEICLKSESNGIDVENICGDIKTRKSEIEAMSRKLERTPS